ncbi:MAG TPA: hypothetical protein VJH96_03690 [Patescibacteria group bacterium]|nr:hypothetical protein [Patescibacteria group bacterium]
MMETPINQSSPTLLYIDLDSCFATITQQSYPHLRGKPLAIVAYAQENSCILSPSKEAKKYGIKTGMKVSDARLLCPRLITQTANVALIRDVHDRFIKICRQYSPHIFPYSIDEVALDMSHREDVSEQTLILTAQSIKKDIRRDIGEWITGSVGIATNRFLAKIAASFKKPDGLYVLNSKNVKQTYAVLTLRQLPGINTANSMRLASYNIFTPLQFLYAPYCLLRHKVFKSITGYLWYMKLRGWEIDDTCHKRKSFSHEYTSQKPLSSYVEISSLLIHLCEKVVRRLRKHGYATQGVSLCFFFADHTVWHTSKTFPQPFVAVKEFFAHAVEIMREKPAGKAVRKLSVGSFHLIERHSLQMGLFDEKRNKLHAVTDAVDHINDMYGEHTVSSALSLAAKRIITDRIAFGKC